MRAPARPRTSSTSGRPTSFRQRDSVVCALKSSVTSMLNCKSRRTPQISRHEALNAPAKASLTQARLPVSALAALSKGLRASSIMFAAVIKACDTTVSKLGPLLAPAIPNSR